MEYLTPSLHFQPMSVHKGTMIHLVSLQVLVEEFNPLKFKVSIDKVLLYHFATCFIILPAFFLLFYSSPFGLSDLLY
jgi:hypothetical protein